MMNTIICTVLALLIIALIYYMYMESYAEKFVPIGYMPAGVSDEEISMRGDAPSQQMPMDAEAGQDGPKGATEGIAQIEPYDSTTTYSTI